ncbi:hypothetical protein G6F57_020352 [Rhizopus arrhizus]|nr:hypothetical protein G6F57_020352 [Rhizopus arrhizus]
MENIQEEPRRSWRVMKFLNEPRNFSGETTKSGNKGLEDVSTAAKVWLNRLERLRFTAKLEDDDILLIAGDHLIGKAEKWWYVVGSKVKTWNDPAIVAANPGVKLPDGKITLVHRSDGSGTTFNFSNYLSKVSPDWKANASRPT